MVNEVQDGICLCGLTNVGDLKKKKNWNCLNLLEHVDWTY